MAIYPAIFIPEEVGGFSVIFPDLHGCQPQGAPMEEALNMAQEALGLFFVCMEEDKQAFPVASDPTDIPVETGQFVSLVSVKIAKYRRNKAVNKMVTLPLWLKEASERENAPFSKILQEGLKQYLHIAE